MIKKLIHLLILYLLTVLFITTPAFAKLPKVIPICDIGAELPAYAYFRRVNGKITTEVTGFSVRYIEQILGAKGIESKVDLIPWKRCQAMVTKGDYAMLLNGSIKPELEKNYFISKTYYKVKDVYFYSKLKPTPKIKSANDLRKLNMCGQAGFNYVNFGVRNEEVDTGAKSFPQVMDKLKAGHCDVVLGRLEYAADYLFTSGVDYTDDKNFGWGELKGMAPLEIHIMVSRELSYSKELIEIINRGIDNMNQSKNVNKLKQEFLKNKN